MKDRIGYIAPFGLRMPSALREWLEGEAARTDRSLNYTINDILTKRMQAATGAKFGDQSPAAALNPTALAGGENINP